MQSGRRNSKSPVVSRKRLFLTQEESQTLEPIFSKKKLDVLDPTTHLTVLKKNYDKIKQSNIKKSFYLDILRAQVNEIKSSASSINTEKQRLENKKLDFESEISKANTLLDNEIELKKVYEHILARNKEEGTILDIQVNKLMHNVKSAKLKLDLENDKALKTKDLKLVTKSMLKELRTNGDEDTKKHISYISTLEKNIGQKREMLKKYEERSKRTKEIIELAVKKDRESHEKGIREKINLNKMLFEILLEKEKRYHKAGWKVEKVFKDIRNNTGLDDAKKILKVFLNREATRTHLVDEIGKAESKLSKIQSEYYVSRDKLKDLLIVTGSDKTEEVGEVNEKDGVHQAYKRLSRIKLQQKVTEITYLEVKKWIKKVLAYFDSESQEKTDQQPIEALQAQIEIFLQEAKQDLNSFNLNLARNSKLSAQDLVKEIYSNRGSPLKSSTKN